MGDSRAPQLTFAAFVVGVASVEIRGDKVAGLWLREIPHKAPWQAMDVAANLVNWGAQPSDVRRFTSRFGPLTVVPPAHGKGGAFAFSLAEWQAAQVAVQNEWRRKLPGRGAPLLGDSGRRFVRPGESFSLVQGRWSYRTATLEQWAALAVLSTPRGRLKKCASTGCDMPFFQAQHLRQRYCSEVCANWAQRKAKREWWGRNRARVP